MNKNRTSFALDALPLPQVISNFDSPNLMNQLIEQHRPVVLKGYAAQWPLMQTMAGMDQSHAILHKLQHTAAKNEVELVTLPAETDGRMFYSDDLQAMNFSRSRMSLSSALARIVEGATDQKKASTPAAAHCVQCISVKQHFSQLTQEYGKRLTPDKASSFFWIGNKVTVAPHFDEAHNIAVVLAGRRRFTLFPPDQIANLYVGPIDFTPAGQPISLVDLHQPQIDTYPRYQHAYDAALSVELEPGDAIFIPQPWWHHVQSLEGFNVLLNFWWDDVYSASQMPFSALVHALQAFRDLPEHQKASWQQLVNHYAFNDTELSTAHLPDNKRGVLGKMTPQKSQAAHNWLKHFIR